MGKWFFISFVVGLVFVLGCGVRAENGGQQMTPAPAVSAASPFLDELMAATWAYFYSAETTTNHLPQSWYSETLGHGQYANTAEIGLYALAWLAAYDQQADWSPGWDETEAEITAVLDQLRAWQTGSQSEQPHGPNAYQNKVFYQWYWIDQTPPVVSGLAGDHLVPSVDNAWLAAALITIRAYARAQQHDALAAKADAIVADLDFRLWYDAQTHLFTWGEVENPQGGDVADVYSNENRIINFVARALGDLTPDEFQASLEAMAQSAGSYGDVTVEKIAYDGSYFTYTSPALFIKEGETDYGANTLNPATAAQIAYAADEAYGAWGLSDCFDVGDGGYVQQGAPPTMAAGSPETRPGLVTPHAAALALITPYAAEAEANLQAIAANYPCAYDAAFGFHDAVMANPAAPDYGQCSDRYSALAQEWLFLSLINHDNGFVWHTFYLDSGVRAAHSEMFDDYAAFLPLLLASGS